MYRKIVTEYWSDPVIEQMGWAGKYVFLYLLTSPLGSLAGCFVVTPKRISKDTELDIETARNGLDEVIESGLAEYNEGTHEVLLKSWPKHNWNLSPNIKTGLVNAIKEVRCDAFREYLEGEFDALEQSKSGSKAASKRLGSSPTVSVTVTDSLTGEGVQGEGKPSVAKEAEEIVSHLNSVLGTNFKPTTKKTVSLISARLNEGFTVDDFKSVIDTKAADWMGDARMSEFLRPETLFGTKFEGYLQKGKAVRARDDAYAKYR